MTLFDHLNNICLDKKPLNLNDKEHTKTYTNYMINRFISMNELYLDLVNEVNKYSTMPKDVHCRFYSSILPKAKQYFKYIKKKKDVNEENKKFISDYFKCGSNDIDRILEILSEDQIKEILKTYTYGQNKKPTLA